MSRFAMSWSFTLVTSLAISCSCGCSSENGSTAATGGSGNGAGGATGVVGAGGSGGIINNTGGAGGTVSMDYQPVSATNQGNLYTLQMGPIKMVIDASVGARITEFSYGGVNVLTGPAVDTNTAAPAHNNYGSTFWTSPQSYWGWPPVAAIDSQAYTGSASSASNSIQLVSGVATIANFASSQIYVTKTFVAVPESGAIDVTYTISNYSASVSVTLAPWQISRVKGTGGMTFFGKGSGSVIYQSGSDPTFQLTDLDSILWYSFATVNANSKALADGAGWIAHATASTSTSSSLLYLLSYPDMQPSEAAPGEAEVEVFTGTNGDYVEIEPQGSFAAIAPGATRSWTVRWKLRQVPSGTSVSAGSAALEAFTLLQRNQ